jgi:hypothetical protein
MIIFKNFTVAFYLTLNVEAICSSKCQLTFTGIHSITFHNI